MGSEQNLREPGVVRASSPHALGDSLPVLYEGQRRRSMGENSGVRSPAPG